MKILLDRSEALQAFETFMRNLKNECREVTARVSWRGACRECEVFVNDRFGFWFTVRRTASRNWLHFGLGDPSVSPGQAPVCELSFPLSGFDRRMNGFFVRFGKDVLAAYSGRPAEEVHAFRQFLEVHGSPLTSHEVEAPGGGPIRALILGSVANTAPGLGVYRFVSAVNDFRQWIAQGLTSEFRLRPVTGLKGTRRVQGCGSDVAVGLGSLVEGGVRELLARRIEARNLRVKLAEAPDGGTVMVSSDNTVLAAFVTLTSLAPESLQSGIGRLLLSRAALRAAKFLVIPGSLGAFFTQALYRHDIQAIPYKLTQDMAVVLDTDAVFRAIQIPGA